MSWTIVNKNPHDIVHQRRRENSSHDFLSSHFFTEAKEDANFSFSSSFRFFCFFVFRWSKILFLAREHSMNQFEWSKSAIHNEIYCRKTKQREKKMAANNFPIWKHELFGSPTHANINNFVKTKMKTKRAQTENLFAVKINQTNDVSDPFSRTANRKKWENCVFFSALTEAKVEKCVIIHEYVRVHIFLWNFHYYFLNMETEKHRDEKKKHCKRWSQLDEFLIEIVGNCKKANWNNNFSEKVKRARHTVRTVSI